MPDSNQFQSAVLEKPRVSQLEIPVVGYQVPIELDQNSGVVQNPIPLAVHDARHRAWFVDQWSLLEEGLSMGRSPEHGHGHEPFQAGPVLQKHG